MDSGIDLHALAKKRGVRKLGASVAFAILAALFGFMGLTASVLPYLAVAAGVGSAWFFVVGIAQMRDPTRSMRNLGASAIERREALADANADLSRATTLRVPTDKGWALVGLKWVAIQGPLDMVVAERREVADVTTARDGTSSKVAVVLRSGGVLHVKNLPSSAFFAQALARVLTTPARSDHFFTSPSSGARSIG